jgi:hypothetical protein
MRTLALCGASCKRRSFFYCTGAAWKSLQLLPLLMVEGCVGRSWAVWTGAMGFADELRMYGVLGSSDLRLCIAPAQTPTPRIGPGLSAKHPPPPRDALGGRLRFRGVSPPPLDREAAVSMSTARSIAPLATSSRRPPLTPSAQGLARARWFLDSFVGSVLGSQRLA